MVFPCPVPPTPPLLSGQDQNRVPPCPAPVTPCPAHSPYQGQDRVSFSPPPPWPYLTPAPICPARTRVTPPPPHPLGRKCHTQDTVRAVSLLRFHKRTFSCMLFLWQKKIRENEKTGKSQEILPLTECGSPVVDVGIVQLPLLSEAS